MNKRLWGAAAGILLALSLADIATAGHSDDPVPGPNGHNTHGLCTAFFNGSETGRENKRDAPPFEQLEEEAGEAGAWAWCNDPANNAKGVGGRPTDPEGNR